MTLMIDKLIAKAIEYEQKGAALRLAAAEMQSEAMNGKQKTAGSQLQAAITLRNGQRNGHTPVKKPTTLVGIPERQATIRAFLRGAAGPQPLPAVDAALAAQGQPCSSSYTLKLMRAMPDAHLQGYGATARWSLGPAKAPKATRSQPGRWTNSQKHAQRARIAQVLAHYDTEKPRAATDIAKSLGQTVAQTGLAPLIANGYLKKKSGGYIRTRKPYLVGDAPAAAADA